MTAALLTRLAPFLKQGVNSALALTGISKLDPRLQKFVSTAALSGFGSDQVINYLRESTAAKGLLDKERELKEKGQTGTLRPDEARLADRFKQEATARDIASGGVALGAGLGAATFTDKEQAPLDEQAIGKGQQAPSGPSEDQARVAKAFEKTGLLEVVDRMSAAGEELPKIHDYIRDVYPPTAISLEKSLGMELSEALAILLGGSPQEAAQPGVGALEAAGGQDELLAALKNIRGAIQGMKGG